MSWLFATVYDPFMRRTERACLSEWRRALLAPLSGSVLEIGAGTGANLPFYPRSLERLVLTDADEHMLRRLRRRPELEANRGEIVRSSADALPFADHSFDAVVSTLVLCSVPDPARTLAEVRRVLRPGGSLVFLEHVAADERTAPSRLRWQHRAEPLWSRLAGGCHLTRDAKGAIEAQGFVLESLERESMRKSLPIVRPTIRGTARRP
ncbi:MAG TPA: methyltransferase domain-containing protein [Labilithrix sp.]|jgi:ubiquinone/menaquinone biosynthesis C-methylase UbiE|nr:methyltransferase domain-containing protein [Labilithrix sp.]